MADPKTAAVKNTNAPKTDAPKADSAAQTAAPKVKKEKKVYQALFDTAEAAAAEAASRTKGPRRAFTAKLGDKVYHIVANNEGRAGGVAFAQIGGSVDEIGKEKKQKKVSVDAVLAALANLPEDERKKVLEQMAKLGK